LKEKGERKVWPKVVQAVLRILPHVPAMVELAERMLGRGTGPQKKETVKRMLKAALEAAEVVSGRDIADNGMYERGIDLMVEGIVLILNSTGRFKGS
jgi:hypothetical protein